MKVVLIFTMTAAVDMSEIRFYCLSETSTNDPLGFAWPCFLTLEKS